MKRMLFAVALLSIVCVTSARADNPVDRFVYRIASHIAWLFYDDGTCKFMNTAPRSTPDPKATPAVATPKPKTATPKPSRGPDRIAE